MSATLERLVERQVEREAAARQLAMGRRMQSIQAGHMGGVLKRWVNTDVVPIADLMRKVAGWYLASDMDTVAELLDTPQAELSSREHPLRPLMAWLLEGRSPGRADTKETTHADDLALTFLGTVVTRVAQDRCTVGAALALAAESLRDTVQGQFVSGVLGASAMQAIRENHPERWKQRKSLNRICARLHAQVRPQLRDTGEQPEGDNLRRVRGKKVLTVLERGEERRLELRPPSVLDWEVMSLTWRDERDGGTHPYRNLWLALAGMFLAATQKVGGWFDVAGETSHRRHHVRTTKYLVLSEQAREAIARDVERWTQAGFAPQPMIVPPESGDYLTVKHRPVTGQRPPMGLLTDPRGTSAWEAAAMLAETPWQVNLHALGGAGESEDPSTIMRVAEHRRIAADTFYLPTCMDFRGRIYYRTPWVTPQSGDLGKSLLRFPPSGREDHAELAPEGKGRYTSLVMHMASLYGNGMDKAPRADRINWWHDWMLTGKDLTKAEKPLSLAAALGLWEDHEWDSIPIQLDGTCNGLQHLSALLRDEVAAPLVNLAASTLEEAPRDIYTMVAHEASGELFGVLNSEGPGEPAWAWRFEEVGLEFTRGLAKRPVMVLPYGGTKDAVRTVVKESVLEQLHASRPEIILASPWHDYHADGYGAFKERPLKDHPLFKTDCNKLADLIWESISPAVPRAMAFMKCLQEIGSWVGERGIAWQCGTPSTGKPLWVVQAKSKAKRKQVTMRGFHLPDTVRRLTLMANANEVDPRANRMGIVANFIHSLDAAHLAASVAAFRLRGGGCVGAVHDNVMVRPSEAALMGSVLRDTFVDLYEADPLSNPVKLTLDGETWDEYPSWYAVADAAGVRFPDRGTFDITEVRKSAWFFS